MTPATKSPRERTSSAVQTIAMPEVATLTISLSPFLPPRSIRQRIEHKENDSAVRPRAGKLLSRPTSRNGDDEDERHQERVDQQAHDLGTQRLEAGAEHQRAGHEQHDAAEGQLRVNRLGTCKDLRRQRLSLRRKSRDARRANAVQVEGTLMRVQARPLPTAVQRAGRPAVSNADRDRIQRNICRRQGSETR